MLSLHGARAAQIKKFFIESINAHYMSNSVWAAMRGTFGCKENGQVKKKIGTTSVCYVCV